MADQDIKLTPLLGYYYLKMLNEEHLRKKTYLNTWLSKLEPKESIKEHKDKRRQKSS